MSDHPVKKACAALASIVICILGLAGPVFGAGQYWQIEYPPSSAAGELQLGVAHTLWIPDGVKTIRCVIVHQHGAGLTAAQYGATAAYDLHWQALANKWDCALLGPSYRVLNDKTDASPGSAGLWFDARRGSDKTFLKALGEFAAKSGHPELATVPWCLWGHSGGGIWSDLMTTLYPQRVVAVFLRSGAAAMFRDRPDFPQPKPGSAVYGVPIMGNAGVKEKPNGAWTGPLAVFQEYRAKGAPVGFAPDPLTGHETGDSRYLAIPFFDACLAMRLPDKGSRAQTLKPVDMRGAWLAPLLGDTAQPAASFKGNPKEAVWLPNEAVAKAWMEYVKTGATSDTTPPPAPFDVRVSAQGDQGTEIVWERRGGFRERHWRFHHPARRAGTGQIAGKAPGQGIRPPVVPGHVLSRHAVYAAAGDALPGRIGQNRAKSTTTPSSA